MPKNKKQAKVCCTDHLFNIQPELPDCYYQDHIKVSLCPHYDKHGNCSGKKTFEGPIYNRDRMASTPAFVLRSEKDKFKYNGSLLGNENAEKYFNGCESKSELLFPKPSSKSFYCNVCKQKYEDYRQHIQGDKHKNKIHSNPFSKHILKLATKYEKERSFKEKEKSAFPPTLSQGTNLIVIDQESQEELLSKPTKRVKIEKDRDEQKKGNQNNIPFMNAYGFLQAQQIIAQQRIFEYYTAVNQMLLNPMTLGYNGYPFQMQAPVNPYLPEQPHMFYTPPGMLHMQQPFLRCLPTGVPGNAGNLRGQAEKQQLIIIQDDI